MSSAKIIIIAGPNGAGKTTFARAFLPQEAQCPRFIRRRFAAGRRNFDLHYRPAVNAWALYDNAGEEPQLIEWGEAP